ncbi:MAG: flagellar protein FliO/FliZ, partial [Paraglaciecola sp.]
SHLAKLEVPLSTDKSVPGDNFKDKLALFMAGKTPQNDQAQGSSKQGKPHA